MEEHGAVSAEGEVVEQVVRRERVAARRLSEAGRLVRPPRVVIVSAPVRVREHLQRREWLASVVIVLREVHEALPMEGRESGRGSRREWGRELKGGERKERNLASGMVIVSSCHIFVFFL